MTVAYFVLFVVAVLGVTKAADWFLEAAEVVGSWLRLPDFVMGVILVGLGTSLPELATGLAAVANGENEVVLGNVIGSNIANVLIILGVSTVLMGTIRFEKVLVDIDLPLLSAVTIGFGLLVIDGVLSRVDAALLLAGFVLYLLYTVFYRDNDQYESGLARLMRTIILDRPRGEPVPAQAARPRVRTWLLLVGSLVGLAVLSQVAVTSLLAVVSEIGIAVGVVSYFALALGTSLPELTVSLGALRRGQGDVVVGNIIGSSMFNVLLVAGLARVVAPQTLALPAGYWMVAGLGVSLLLLIVSGITTRIHLWEGAGFVLVYVALALQIL